MFTTIFPEGNFTININIGDTGDSKNTMVAKDSQNIIVNAFWLKIVPANIVGSVLGHELVHINDILRNNVNVYDASSVGASEYRAYSWQF